MQTRNVLRMEIHTQHVIREMVDYQSALDQHGARAVDKLTAARLNQQRVAIHDQVAAHKDFLGLATHTIAFK